MSKPIWYPVSGTQIRNPERTIWPAWSAFILIVFSEIFPAGFQSFLMLYLMFFAVATWMSSGRRLPPQLVRLVGPLLLIIFVGLLESWGHPTYEVLKDVWYIGNAALVLATGYILMSNLKDIRPFFGALVVAGGVTASFHLLRFAFHPELLDLPASDIREAAGLGSFAPVAALAVLVGAWQAKIPILARFKWLAYLCFVLCVASIVLSFSRTKSVALILILAALFGWIRFDSRTRVALIAVSALALFAIAYTIPAPTSLAGAHTFMDKVLYSAQEVKIRDYYSLVDIMHNWRGYESSRWWHTYKSGDPLQYLIGQGLGTSVDLLSYEPLGIRYAPVAHSGYMYLLVKTGLVGLALYLGLLLYLVRTGTVLSQSSKSDVRLSGRLIVGIALTYLATTGVISGLLNKGGLISIALLVGALLAYAQITSGQFKRVGAQ